eukprot:scaffold217288_cov16-Tisochrysis_lutea.AAC.1
MLFRVGKGLPCPTGQKRGSVAVSARRGRPPGSGKAGGVPSPPPAAPEVLDKRSKSSAKRSSPKAPSSPTASKARSAAKQDAPARTEKEQLYTAVLPGVFRLCALSCAQAVYSDRVLRHLSVVLASSKASLLRQARSQDCRPSSIQALFSNWKSAFLTTHQQPLLLCAPEPLGPSKQGSAVNFALYGKCANSVTLCLYDENNSYLTELPLSKTGGMTSVAFLFGWEHYCLGSCNDLNQQSSNTDEKKERIKDLVHQTRCKRENASLEGAPISETQRDIWHAALENLPLSGICYGYKKPTPKDLTQHSSIGGIGGPPFLIGCGIVPLCATVEQ